MNTQPTNTQQIAWQSAPGGPELIEIIEAPIPEPAAGEVRVRVAAAGLNPIDWKIAAVPAIAQAFGVTVPGGYGNDFSGVVDAVGPGVDRPAIGTLVFGGARAHAVAEFTVVPAASLTIAPEDLDLVTAATLPVAGTTASAVIDGLGLSPDDAVLIGGAAGGVGLLAVQLAVRTGATVIATASERNHGLLRELGATPVTYGPGLADRVRAAIQRPLTAATDLQGVDTARTAIELGVSPSRINAIAGMPEDLPAGVVRTGGGAASAGALDHLATLIAAGDVRVFIDEVYPLADTARAIEQLQQGHVRGKLVIGVDTSIR